MPDENKPPNLTTTANDISLTTNNGNSSASGAVAAVPRDHSGGVGHGKMENRKARGERVAWRIVGSMQQGGLGLVSWW